MLNGYSTIHEAFIKKSDDFAGRQSFHAEVHYSGYRHKGKHVSRLLALSSVHCVCVKCARNRIRFKMYTVKWILKLHGWNSILHLLAMFSSPLNWDYVEEKKSESSSPKIWELPSGGSSSRTYDNSLCCQKSKSGLRQTLVARDPLDPAYGKTATGYTILAVNGFMNDAIKTKWTSFSYVQSSLVKITCTTHTQNQLWRTFFNIILMP